MTKTRMTVGWLMAAAFLLAADSAQTRGDDPQPIYVAKTFVSIATPQFNGPQTERKAIVDFFLELKSSEKKCNSVTVTVREFGNNADGPVIPEQNVTPLLFPEPGKKYVTNTIRFPVTPGKKYIVGVVMSYTDGNGVEREIDPERVFVAH